MHEFGFVYVTSCIVNTDNLLGVLSESNIIKLNIIGSQVDFSYMIRETGRISILCLLAHHIPFEMHHVLHSRQTVTVDSYRPVKMTEGLSVYSQANIYGGTRKNRGMRPLRSDFTMRKTYVGDDNGMGALIEYTDGHRRT